MKFKKPKIGFFLTLKINWYKNQLDFIFIFILPKISPIITLPLRWPHDKNDKKQVQCIIYCIRNISTYNTYF